MTTLIGFLRLMFLFLHFFSSGDASADGWPSEPASAGSAGAQHPAKPTEDLPGWNWLTAAGQTVVPAAACSGPRGKSKTAKRNGQHAGKTDSEAIVFFHEALGFVCIHVTYCVFPFLRLDRWLSLVCWNIWSWRMWHCLTNSLRPNTDPSKKKSVLLFSCRVLRYISKHACQNILLWGL